MTKLFNGFVQTGKVEDTKRILTNLILSHDASPEASELYNMSSEERKNLYLLWDFLDSVNKLEAVKLAKTSALRMFNFTCCLYLIWVATVPTNVLLLITH